MTGGRSSGLRRAASLVLLAAFAGCGRPPSTAAVAPDESQRWVGSWEAAPQLVEPGNMPPAPGLAGRTLRQTIHLTLGGSRWRFRISNEFSNTPLTIDAAHVARSVGLDTIDVATDVALTFGGRTSLTIPAGGAVTSDVVSGSFAPLSGVAISLHVVEAPAALTGHPGSRTTSFVAEGSVPAARALPTAARTDHWYLITGAEVMAPRGAAAVVVLGNSIADGRGSGTNRNDRWPDNLARRLQANAGTSNVAVLNAGIGGNAVTRGGLGPTGLERLQRDVLEQPGVQWLILSEGVNDIGGAPPGTGAAVAARLIDAYREIVSRAHARGLRVYGATILPFGGSQYGSAEHEEARRTVNAWIRGGGAFDALIDLDAAMRDPANPERLAPAADGGDHLHPNEAGYVTLANAIDLRLFAGAGRY